MLDEFAFYSAAIAAIKETEFEFTDTLPDGKSSWIISASYYICYDKTGYLIFITDKGNEQIHEKVPINV